MLWRYLQTKTTFFDSSDVKMLHIAAEPCFEPKFRRHVAGGYTTADLLLTADVKMDISDIQYDDQTFDIICCSHVLEHVPDDRKAMRELCRILKLNGWAIFMVPITVDKTVEDPSITDPKERLRLFGQDDHVRRYGPDFVDRLKEAGFDVCVTHAEDFLTSDEIARISVAHELTGGIFHCRPTKS